MNIARKHIMKQGHDSWISGITQTRHRADASLTLLKSTIQLNRESAGVSFSNCIKTNE